MRTDALFEENHLTEYLEHLRKQAVAAAEKIPEAILAANPDEEIAARIAGDYRVEMIELDREAAEFSTEEIQVDVSQDFRRAILDPSRPFYIKGTRWILHVPFTGDRNIFRYRPSHYFLSRFFGRVKDGELLVSFDQPDGDERDVQAETLGQLDSIEQVLGNARSDVESHNNNQLEREIISALGRRRAEIARDKEQRSKITIPIRSDPGPESRPAATVQRRPERPTRAATSGLPSAKARATLAAEYEHIIEVLRTYGRQMERSPKSFATSETGRRDAMLGALATHYKGQAFAEAFNRRGKTDILLREEDENLFVCECKIWEGAQAFSDAIDQLLGYATWHDTRLAIVVFVEQKDLSRVLAAATKALSEHEAFGVSRKSEHDAELRCELKFPGDEAQRLQLAVLFVHLVG